MSESPAVPEGVPAGEPSAAPGVLATLGSLYLEPRTAFTAIARRASRWWIPMLGCVVLNLILIGVWLHKMDPHQFMADQIEEQGGAKTVPNGDVEAAVNQRAPFVKPFAWVAGTIFPPIAMVVFAALLMFIYRFFYEGQFSFAQALSVVTWQSLTVVLVTIPLILIVMFAKGEWSVDPASMVNANLSVFLEKGQVSKALFALAGSFDLFTFWTQFLLASGFGVLTRKPTAGAFWGVFIPWCLWIAVKVGYFALRG